MASPAGFSFSSAQNAETIAQLEDVFESAYADRLAQQEARWARKVGASPDVATASETSRAELKRLVRQGVPAARRKVVWPACCRAAELRAAA